MREASGKRPAVTIGHYVHRDPPDANLRLLVLIRRAAPAVGLATTVYRGRFLRVFSRSGGCSHGVWLNDSSESAGATALMLAAIKAEGWRTTVQDLGREWQVRCEGAGRGPFVVTGALRDVAVAKAFVVVSTRAARRAP